MKKSEWIASVVTLSLIVQAFSSCSDSDNSTGSVPDSPPVQSGVSFRMDVLPILSRYGCTGCHGGRAGLNVGSVAGLLQGGDHGPAIVAGKADSSLLVQKISSNPPFGDRMTLSG